VANAAIIVPLAREIDQMFVCFRKFKGHGWDEWNNLADTLAVRADIFKRKR
jgi:hypothetical protein